MPNTQKAITDSIMEPTERLLELIGLAHDGADPLTVFAGEQGEGDFGLVVVDRAPEGGETTFSADDVASSYGRKKVIKALRESTPSRGDLSSPFWETARAVAREADESGVEEGGWVRKIGWTQLYRVVPATGSLSGELRTLQQGLCAQLFWREILIWRPRRVLLMTGLQWAAPFLFAHHSAEIKQHDPGEYDHVRASGALRLQGAKTPALVVIDPPAAGQAEACAQEVGSVFASLGG